jgi:hypothetical protein
MEDQFENFDPENFDPENYTGKKNKGVYAPPTRGGLTTVLGALMAQVDIKIVNAGLTNEIVELFGRSRTFADITNTSVNAYGVFGAVNRAAANLNSLVYWLANGDLAIQNAAGAVTTVSCKQVPYRTLFNSSGIQPFKIEKVRLTVTNDSQIDNDINDVELTFLGKVNRNSLSPRSFLNPTQFQSKIIDIPYKVEINSEKSIQYQVNAGETVTFNFFISQYRKLNLM